MGSNPTLPTMVTDFGTRKTDDDRDGAQVTVQLTAPAGQRQVVMLPERSIERSINGVTTYVKLASVEQVLWPFCD